MAKIPIYGIREFSENEKENYFYSNDLRSHLKSHQFINSPHKHSTYITILFTKGSGEHHIDFDTYKVKPGSIFLLNPGQVHSWNLSKDANGYVFLHTKQFYDSIFINRKMEDFPFFYLQQNYPVIYLSTNDCKRIESLFETVNKVFHANNPYKEAQLGTLTDLIYLELAQLYKPKDKVKEAIGSNYQKIKRLEKLIDENYKAIKSPSKYSDLMYMSIRHLNRICQESIKKTTGDLIFDRIIVEAKRMLIQKNIILTDISEELGYDDHSYFIRLFKKKTGETPKEFQKRMNKTF